MDTGTAIALGLAGFLGYRYWKKNQGGGDDHGNGGNGSTEPNLPDPRSEYGPELDADPNLTHADLSMEAPENVAIYN